MTVEVADERRPVVENTPGFLGYLLAVLLCWALISVGSMVGAALLEEGVRALRFDDLGSDLEGLVMWSMVVGFFGVLTAPFGVAAVHFACRRSPDQLVHVAAAGAIGVLTVYALAIGLGESWRDWDRLAAGVGACTALGRAAVIPLVPAVRRRRAGRREGKRTGTPTGKRPGRRTAR